MSELMGNADQITSYGFSSTDLGNKAVKHGGKAEVYSRFGVDRKKVSRLKEEFFYELSKDNLLPEAVDEQRARDVLRLMQDEGMTMNKAYQIVGIDRKKCRRILEGLVN